MDLTSFLAVWGALLSTVAVTWNVFRDWGDRGRIKVEAMIGKMVPNHTDKDYLIVTITNVGRRPILVKGWGARRKKKAPGPRWLFVVARGLPRMLPEGDYHTEFTDDLANLASDIEDICVWDSAGRYWKAPRKMTRQVITKVQELQKSLGKPEPTGPPGKFL